MKQIINPWIGVEGYNCFGCNPDNPIGVHMHFYEDGDDIVSVWKPTNNHISWVNTLHGGIQAVLLDEICGWVLFWKVGTSGVTAKMETRYKAAVDTTLGYVILRARLKEQRRNVSIIEGQLFDANGQLCAQCECTYFGFPEEKAKEYGFVKASLADEEVSLEEVIQKTVRELHE